MELGLTDKACIVTGASRGIGRAVSELLQAEGYSYRDIAAALELNEGSVGTLLARARRAFLAAYGRESDASR